MTQGQKLRKARNLIARVDRLKEQGQPISPYQLERYARACALVLAHLLSKPT